MAQTKLWSKRRRPGQSTTSVIEESCDYVKDEKKTKDLSISLVDNDDEDFAADDITHTVLKYVVNTKKTKLEEIFVSGINCEPATVDSEFMAVKEFWNKTDKNILWHGEQGFKPGEIDPHTAHEIGRKLAQKMWGDKFQILVTTHIDKAHIHNHFVFNSVSFVDGKKYHYDYSEIYRLRRESDKLCREYGLSVIETPKSKGISHFEWENGGNPKTVRGLIKEDIDEAIENSETLREVYSYLEQKLGYEVNTRNKYVTLRPPGSEKNFRLDNLDKNRKNPNHKNRYTEEAIVYRLNNKSRATPTTYELSTDRRQNKPSYKKYHTQMKNNCFDLLDAVDFILTGTSIRGAYWRYYYFLKNMNLIKTQYPTTHFAIRREAQRKIKSYQNELRFMSKYRIGTVDEIKATDGELKDRLKSLEAERSECRYILRYSEDANKQKQIIEKIAQLNSDIARVREDSKVCEDILSKTDKINEELDKIQKDKNKTKERNETQWQQKMQLSTP